MTTKYSETFIPQQITGVQLASDVNVAGVYSNGPSNDGVGATILTASATLTIDSVLVVNGNSVLLYNQTIAAQNGIYVVSGVGFQILLTRRADFQNPSQMLPGYYLTVSSGTVLAGSIFTIIAPAVTSVGIGAINIATSTVAPSEITSVTLANNGLNVLNSAGTFPFTIVPNALITAPHVIGLDGGTGDAYIVWSAFPDLIFTAFGGAFVGTASYLTARPLLGIKSGTTATNAGSSTTCVFTATGLLATDIVTASVLTQAVVASIVLVIPSTNTLTVTFTTAPGAGTSVQWIAVATV